MIPVVVFYLHIVGVVTAFTKSWQDDGLTDGMLTLAFIGLIFVVGWTLSSFLIRLIVPHGFGKVLNTDALSLLLLTTGEAVFYYLYFIKHKK